jgi:hypothetical protein
MKRIFLIFFLLFICVEFGFSQGRFVMHYKDSDKINFKLINNLIVIPVEVNGVELSFILDTGVSKSILFNFLNLSEELQINQTERIYLRGLGEGESVEALRSKNNVLKIGEAVSIGQDLYAIFDPSLNFTPKLGLPVHGIIGYDLFRDFVVEINYAAKQIKLHNQDTYVEKKCKKCKEFKLEFHNKKPFIEGMVQIDESEIPVKLLVDSGGSDALWLFEDSEKGIHIPEKYFDDFLGRGLSGSVYGKRSKVRGMRFDDFRLKNVNVAFPDSSSISFARKVKDRNGSIGGEVLRRFNVIFNYNNSKVVFKKNKNFNAPFYYNKSGIVLEHNGVRMVREQNKQIERNVETSYGNEVIGGSAVKINLAATYKYVLAPSFEIVELRKDSPAEKAGLKLGDVVLKINQKEAHSYSIQQITQIFYGEDGKRIRMLVDRNGIQMKFSFLLESLLK